MTLIVGPKTVLIAVEDPNILYLLQRYAEECGFQTVGVAAVARGRPGGRLHISTDVLNLARSLRPILIILDGTMPQPSDQKRLMRDLRANPDTCTIPVVLYCTLDAPPENWDAGVAAYLPKSVRYDDFRAVLAHTGAP